MLPKRQDCSEGYRAAARGKLSEGYRVLAAGHTEGKHWDAAVDCFFSGLAVQGIEDEELTAALQEALASAEKGRAARNEARAAAAQHHAEGEAQYTSRDYPASISNFKAALALDTQSEELVSHFAASLATAQQALSDQENARAEASVLVERAEQAAVAKDYIVAIEAYEAASRLDVNDAKLTESHRLRIADTQASLDAARVVARGKL
eukprot:COSAG02_NODE_25023_length_671_cov_0.522727_1_plen_206_part_10